MTNKTYSWQTALINAVTQPQELIELLELDPSLLSNAKEVGKLFPLKVPRSFIDRMQKRDPYDPLLLQVLPLGAELEQKAGFLGDPLQEKQVNPIPGLLHKYQNRVLLIFTGTCAINCRYCFRRHFPYQDNQPSMAEWDSAIDYIANDNSITEVILSGGDPLLATDAVLEKIISKVAAISHVKRLRIHSRIPIVLPERVTPEFIAAITTTRLKVILVVHSNHPQELDQTVKQAMDILNAANITLLNQTVLLKGINDNAPILAQLSEKLFAFGILPYYLHILDKVQGTTHFDLAIESAKQIHWELTQRLSGYLVPRLVSEQPNAPAKLLINGTELFTG
jgi:EF-P beta-lysylation protein EpmB